MTSENPLVRLLIQHEGQVKQQGQHVPYDDKTGARFDQGDTLVGKMTVGIGRNLTDVGISDDEAMLLLTNDVEKVRCQLNTALPWWTTLNEVRQAVLISMAFNMGTAGLLKFKVTLGHIQRGEYVQGAAAMLESAWAKQVGPRARMLSTMMATGLWPQDL